MATTVEVIGADTGEIVRVIRSEAEKESYSHLPALIGVQRALIIDITANPSLSELVDGNAWRSYRVVAGRLQKDGLEVFIHPDTEAEADRRALPGFIDDLRNASLAPLPASLQAYLDNSSPTSNQSRDAIKALITFHEDQRGQAFTLTRKLSRVVRFLAKTMKVF